MLHCALAIYTYVLQTIDTAILLAAKVCQKQTIVMLAATLA